MQFAFSLVAAAATLLMSTHARATADNPDVYTGYLHHRELGLDQAMRLAILPFGDPVAGKVRHEVIFSLHEGDIDGPEYTAFALTDVQTVRSTGELIATRNDDGRNVRLPILRVQVSADRQTVTGRLISRSQGEIGHFNLKKGFALPPSSASARVQAIGGYYRAQCAPPRSFAYHLYDLKIFPSRVQGPTEHESTLSSINYIGTSRCAYAGDDRDLRSCGEFTRGVYNVFEQKLILDQGELNRWTCSIQGPDSMRCDSAVYRNCELRRVDSATPHRDDPRESSKAITPPPRQTAATCDDWGGDFGGHLRHRRDGREQLIDLQLIAFESGDGVCTLLGTVVEHFGTARGSEERKTYPLNQVTFAPDAASVTLRSDGYTDLYLELRAGEEGQLSGQWYSGLYGYVGAFAVDHQGRNDEVERPIIGPAGNYTFTNNRKISLALTVFATGIDKKSHDPFGQSLKVTGHIQRRLPDIASDARIYSSVTGGSWDYFTNYFVLQTQTDIFAGEVHHDQLLFARGKRGFDVIAQEVAYREIYGRL